MQFLGSVLLILILSNGALLMAMAALAEALDSRLRNPQAPIFMLIAASIFNVALLLVPSAYYALNRMAGRAGAPIRWPERLRPGLWLALFPWVILVGLLASRQTLTALLILPPLHILALGLPLAWIVTLGVRGLPLGSPQRAWGVFATGLVAAPALIMVLEGLAILGFVVLFALYLTTQPAVMGQLQALIEQMPFEEPPLEEIFALLAPYLERPAAALAVFGMIAVVVPLIEEALKPLGVWLLVGRPLSARAGFAAGVLSGAGFALSENMLFTSNPGEWALVVLARFGTAAVHIFTAGLVGWALATAWKRRRYGLLALTYLLAVLVHGLWNGLTVAMAYHQLLQLGGRSPAWLGQVALVTPGALFLLAVGCLVGVWWGNRRLQRKGAKSPEDRSLPTLSPELLP